MGGLLDVAGKRSQAMNRACSRAGCVGTAETQVCHGRHARRSARCCANEGGNAYRRPFRAGGRLFGAGSPTESCIGRTCGWPSGPRLQRGPHMWQRARDAVVRAGACDPSGRLCTGRAPRRELAGEGHPMSYGNEGAASRRPGGEVPDVDTLLITSHRDSAGSSGLSCSAELVSLRTAEWNPFGCPEHPGAAEGQLARAVRLQDAFQGRVLRRAQVREEQRRAPLRLHAELDQAARGHLLRGENRGY